MSRRDIRLGHNRTRPPPFMGWRGPCATCRTSLASCPARPAKPTAPPGPVTRAIYQFPGASHVPGVSPEWCPFPAVKAFLRPSPAAAQGVESYLLRVFSLSTERRRLSAIECGYPPHHSQAIHRSRRVYRPRGRVLVRLTTRQAVGGDSPAGAAAATATPSATPGAKFFDPTTTRENTSGVFSRL